MLEGRGADIHQAYCQGFPHFSKETKRPKNQIKEQYFRFFSVPPWSGQCRVSHPLAPTQSLLFPCQGKLTYPAQPLPSLSLPLPTCALSRLPCLIGAVSFIQAGSRGAFSHALSTLL